MGGGRGWRFDLSILGYFVDGVGLGDVWELI